MLNYLRRSPEVIVFPILLIVMVLLCRLPQRAVGLYYFATTINQAVFAPATTINLNDSHQITLKQPSYINSKVEDGLIRLIVKREHQSIGPTLLIIDQTEFSQHVDPVPDLEQLLRNQLFKDRSYHFVEPASPLIFDQFNAAEAVISATFKAELEGTELSVPLIRDIEFILINVDEAKIVILIDYPQGKNGGDPALRLATQIMLQSIKITAQDG